MIKFWCLLVVLATLSGAGYMLGYLYGNLEIIPTTIAWAWDSAPVIRASLVSTVIFVTNMALAFFTCRGNYESFRMEFMALTAIILTIFLFVAWPRSIDELGFQAHFHYAGLFPIMVAHIVVGRILAKEFWEYGGRSIDGENCCYPVNSETDFLREYRYRVLEDTSYVIECVASEMTGEAKSELNRLIERTKDSTVPEKDFLTKNLREAAAYLAKDQNRYAAVSLERITRFLWKQVREKQDA